ncbi:GL25143 [Drosophila persimilis]|uniref:GL25143 n=1 Tax=Drosophila persimilis TaxID=7234 RepID=B4GR42_DROPE|nr:GL25143 [Drosophila persimilis]
MERRGEWGMFSRRSDAEAHLIEITRVDGSRRALWKGGGEAAFPRPRDASRVHYLNRVAPDSISRATMDESELQP